MSFWGIGKAFPVSAAITSGDRLELQTGQTALTVKELTIIVNNLLPKLSENTCEIFVNGCGFYYSSVVAVKVSPVDDRVYLFIEIV